MREVVAPISYNEVGLGTLVYSQLHANGVLDLHIGFLYWWSVHWERLVSPYKRVQVS